MQLDYDLSWLPTEPACVARHSGPWAIEPTWLSEQLAALQAGLYSAQKPREPSGELYTVIAESIAYIPVIGPITKGESKYGGVSSVATRRALRAAWIDETVKGVLLHVDSPGGMTAGTAELAAEVARWGNRGPVWAYIEDLGASAAYWVASQAERVLANAPAKIGSIGTYAVIRDYSEQAKMEGVKVYVISSGEYKASGEWGTEITVAQRKEVQRLVDGTNAFFVADVSKGRNRDREEVEGWADGRIWLAAEAKKLGLIDEVTTFEQTIRGLVAKVTPRRDRQRILGARMNILMSQLAAYQKSVDTK